MTGPLVETHGLSKRYGNLRAVEGLDLRLEEGEVYGFLGPNGSGKSTTILMILGLTEPTAGTVSVMGHDPTRNPTAVKRQVGYLPESVGFYGDLTGRQNLLYTAELNGIKRREAEGRVAGLLDTVQLHDAANQQVAHYSRGMRQRLGLADVLLKDPRLVILDDPTLGLDPAGIQWLLRLIEQMAHDQNISVFLSSHALEDVQRVCSRVGIMSQGKMVLEGTIEQLTAGQEGGGFEVQVEVDVTTDAVLTALRALPSVTRCEATGRVISVASTEDVRARIAETVLANGATPLEVRSRNRTLEEIYLRYFQPEEALA